MKDSPEIEASEKCDWCGHMALFTGQVGDVIAYNCVSCGRAKYVAVDLTAAVKEKTE